MVEDWIVTGASPASAPSPTPGVPPLPAIDTLSLAQQVGQMVVVRASGYLSDRDIAYPQWEPPQAILRSLIADRGVGGVLLLGGSAAEVALRVRQLQEWATIPLLVAADVEEGVGHRFAGATWFPPPMALQSLPREAAIAHAEAMGAITAAEAAAIGVNWILAPIVDVNSNPHNPVINVRAFGESPSDAIALSGAFIRGAKSAPVLTTAKHFPGHGDTAVDSHLQTPTITGDRERLESVELPPFAAAIGAGVEAVMSAHLFAPVLDAQHIATLSRNILTDLLRHQMGFSGLVVTDALVMAGVTSRYDPATVAVKAVQAGADILLMPPDPVLAIRAVCEAVEAGAIPRDRIRASVERIWHAKQRVCLPVDVDRVAELGSAPSWEVAASIAQQSQRTHGTLALDGWGSATNLLVVDDPLACHDILHARAPAVRLFRQRGAHALLVDGEGLAHFQCSDRVVMQVFSRGNPFRTSAAVHRRIASFVDTLVREDRLLGLLVYGSPYNLDALVPMLSPHVAWGFSYGQQPEAQEALLGALGFAAPGGRDGG